MYANLKKYQNQNNITITMKNSKAIIFFPKYLICNYLKMKKIYIFKNSYFSR